MALTQQGKIQKLSVRKTEEVNTGFKDRNRQRQLMALTQQGKIQKLNKRIQM
jgi:hypothetical protein